MFNKPHLVVKMYRAGRWCPADGFNKIEVGVWFYFAANWSERELERRLVASLIASRIARCQYYMYQIYSYYTWKCRCYFYFGT